jgi:hypothetical protein
MPKPEHHCISILLVLFDIQRKSLLSGTEFVWELLKKHEKMNRVIIALIAVLISFSACEKKKIEMYPECLNLFGEFTPNNKPMDGEAEFVFYKNSALEVNEDENYIYFNKVEGDQLVFKYEFTADDNPMIADDEYGESIWFAVDAEADSFDIPASDFKDANVIFGRMCFCADRGYHRISDGCIHGEKVSENKWAVAFVIRSSSDYDTYIRMIEGEFEVGE